MSEFTVTDEMKEELYRIGALGREVLLSILEEFNRASSFYKSFVDAHKGYAVLLEKFDELWVAVKMKPTDTQRRPQLQKEGVHVAAMAFRFLYDICKEHYSTRAINREKNWFGVKKV